MKKVLQKWYWLVIGGFLLFAALVFIIVGKDSVIAVPDNLDLFIPQYQMMKDTGTFFGHEVPVPFLANISRDYLPSEFSLYSLVYMTFDAYSAYIICYFLKIAVGLTGCVLLAKDILKDKFKEYETIIWLSAFAFSVLNLFPNFGVAFTSIPFLILILRKINEKSKILWVWYIVLFCYPFVSYFSYFGIFLIGFLFIYFIFRCISKRRFAWELLIAVSVLAIGYALFEYRLFYRMLFSDVVSIRSTMVQLSLGWKDIIAMMWEGFAIGDMHTGSMQQYFVMPVCLLYFILQTIGYIVRGKAKKIFTDYFNGILLFIIFNSMIYGLYYCEPVRDLFETVLPPLTGFEFHRAEFVNPFLWYVAFFIILKRMYDYLPKLKFIPAIMAVSAIAVIVFVPTEYNDLMNTVKSEGYKLIKGKPGNALSFDEFYSEDLFKKAKEDIGYCGEWSVAYGFYPAVLEYNGIHTLDGYLGYYSKNYKEDFGKIIAPALKRVPESKAYYDNWGARCYMYSGTYTSNTNPYRNYEYTDEDLYMNVNAFKDYLGRYIFSRVRLNNADEMGFDLVNTYTDEKSPYTLYLYKTKSRYPDSVHIDVPYEERTWSYDTDKMDEYIKIMEDLTQDASSKVELLPENQDPSGALSDRDIEDFKNAFYGFEDEMDEMITGYTLVDLKYKADVTRDDLCDMKNEIYADYMDYYDRLFQVLREAAQSPYFEVLVELYNGPFVESLKDYEDMTDEQKDRNLKLRSLEHEYEEASIEEYYYTYKGHEWSQTEMYEKMADLEYDDLLHIYYGLCEQKALVMGDIYKQIVTLRNETARDEDYDNYPEYAYPSVYARDYKPKDVKELATEIRSCAKIAESAENYLELINNLDPGFITADSRSTFEALRPTLNNIDPELIVPLDCLLRNNLFDLEHRDTKTNAGFTTSFPKYGDAFILDQPYLSSMDFYTYIHEFGHYNNVYYIHEDDLCSWNNMDTAEIHSQGLEVLFSKHYRDFMDEETADYLAYYEICNLMGTIVSTIKIGEFEIYAFENPDATIEELSRYYAELDRQYGQDLPEDIDADYSWVEIGHLFLQPIYYVSYGVSALAALDIYVTSFDDERVACEKYMEITSLTSAWGLREALQYVGLPDVFRKGEAKKIMTETLKNIKPIAKKYS